MSYLSTVCPKCGDRHNYVDPVCYPCRYQERLIGHPFESEIKILDSFVTKLISGPIPLSFQPDSLQELVQLQRIRNKLLVADGKGVYE